MSGDKTVNADDFMESFEEVRAPYQVSDSIFGNQENDSNLISYKIFTQFVPDTVITKHYPKGIKPKLYALTKLKADKKQDYLFCMAESSTKEVLYLLCFDKSNKFIASKVLFAYDRHVNSFANIDSRYTITVTRQHKSPEGNLLYSKDAYMLNDAGSFVLILTESNDAASRPGEIVNPIDTLPHKHKFSGDYVIDKKNFISVRDGKNASVFLFFVHFEKDGSTCNGELKGQAKFNSATGAQYHGNLDPCVINFSFSTNKVTIKEVEGCGNHRDIKCFFDGTFIKKKEPKPKTPPGKKKTGRK
ncbi:MAG: hypothetical protein JST13_10185 [Bacteroidetes bacterium]|nr:hypothetical protein [Bacteroidota bacterium]